MVVALLAMACGSGDPGPAAVAEPAGDHSTATTAPDITGQCLPLGGPSGCVISGSISAAGENDAYKIVLNATDNLELAFYPQVDAAAVLTDQTLSLNRPPRFITALAQLPSHAASDAATPPTAGTYYVLIKGLPGGRQPTGSYLLSVRTVPSP
jgi:hypothetical protein